MKTMNRTKVPQRLILALFTATLFAPGCVEGPALTGEVEPQERAGAEPSARPLEGDEPSSGVASRALDPEADPGSDGPDQPSPALEREEVSVEMLEGLESLSAEALKARGPELNCVPAGEEGTLVVMDTIEASGERVVQTLGSAPCTSTIGLQALNGAITPISAAPGAYYNASALRVGESLVVAWTTIEHEGWESEEGGRMVSREVNPVVELAVRDAAGAWHEPERLVDLDEAVWLGRLSLVEEKVTLLFWRDSLFEHLFFTQEGRPESDGLYALTLGVDGAEVSTGILTRVQDYVMNFDPAGDQE